MTITRRKIAVLAVVAIAVTMLLMPDPDKYPFDEGVGGAAFFCYRTQSDVYFFIHEDMEACPEQDQMERFDFGEVAALERVGGSPFEIEQTAVVLVPKKIDCGGKSAVGCSDGYAILIYYTSDREIVSKIYEHELGHVISQRRHGNPDPNHTLPYYP